jgi:hypothetical protein
MFAHSASNNRSFDFIGNKYILFLTEHRKKSSHDDCAESEMETIH